MSIEDEKDYISSDNSSSSESREEESPSNDYKSSSFGGLGVINLKGKKDKKKRKITKGPLKDWDTIEKGLIKASLRLSDAYSRGIEEYLEKRERSADHKRDGAAVDSYENITKAIAKTVKIAGEAPYEIAKVISELKPSKKEKKRIVRQLRKESKITNKVREKNLIEQTKAVIKANTQALAAPKKS